jgi:hypothetical protein
MIAQVNYPFHDIKEGILRKSGDVFELTDERLEEIQAVDANLVTVLEGTKIEKKTTKRSKKENA